MQKLEAVKAVDVRAGREYIATGPMSCGSVWRVITVVPSVGGLGFNCPDHGFHSLEEFSDGAGGIIGMMTIAEDDAAPAATPRLHLMDAKTFHDAAGEAQNAFDVFATAVPTLPPTSDIATVAFDLANLTARVHLSNGTELTGLASVRVSSGHGYLSWTLEGHRAEPDQAAREMPF